MLNGSVDEPSATFSIKRYTPEEVIAKLSSIYGGRRKLTKKSYNLTNDQQRLDLIQSVFDKELTIKEVTLLHNFRLLISMASNIRLQRSL